ERLGGAILGGDPGDRGAGHVAVPGVVVVAAAQQDRPLRPARQQRPRSGGRGLEEPGHVPPLERWGKAPPPVLPGVVLLQRMIEAEDPAVGRAVLEQGVGVTAEVDPADVPDGVGVAGGGGDLLAGKEGDVMTGPAPGAPATSGASVMTGQ